MQRGLNSTTIQKANRSLVIKIMLAEGPVSRVELVKKTRLRKATITNIINEFLELGIICEEGFTKVDSGRRTEAFRIDMPQLVILSIRFTRKFYRATLYDLRGVPLAYHQDNISVDEDILIQMELVMTQIDAMLAAYDKTNILGICIALPGPYIRGKDKNTAIVTGFDNLRKIDVEKMFTKRYPFKILSEHDAKLAAFAEWKHMKMDDNVLENSLMQIQSIGIGVGAGSVINGRIIKGAVGVAGEIGHMGINFNGPKSERNNQGAFEYYAGTESCCRYLQEMMYQYPQSPLREDSKYEEILQAYYAGDELARAVIGKLAWMLGYGIASLAFVLNPNRVVIDNDYPRTEEFILMVKQTVKQMVYAEVAENMHIHFSQLTSDSTLLGGYYHVLEQYLKNNSIIDKIRDVVGGKRTIPI